MTPGAGMTPTWENDLSLESNFHIRMSPSQEPLNGLNQSQNNTYMHGGGGESPEAMISEYRKLARAVIQRGVRTTPSVSE